jgi:hypothetical protein
MEGPPERGLKRAKNAGSIALRPISLSAAQIHGRAFLAQRERVVAGGFGLVDAASGTYFGRIRVR